MDANGRQDAGQGTPATETREALAMLSAFASVGARSFDVTMTDIEGNKTGFQSSRSVEQLRGTIGKALQAAKSLRQNYIIRPRSTKPSLIQLDDLDSAKIKRLEPHAFMIIETSPGNFQAWVAVSDAPAEAEAGKDFARQFRKGAGADLTASGATRIAGSRNFKTKYAPAFPLVTVSHVNPGNLADTATLNLAGLVSAPEQPRPPRTESVRVSAGRRSRKAWPSYQICVQGAPRANGEDKPDISRADFTWCRTAIEWGWSVEATAARLQEFSSKAKENGEAYAMQTASRAAASVDKQPYRQKPSPNPA